MTLNRMWVKMPFFCHTIESHHISFHDQQDVSDTAIISLPAFHPVIAVCEWHHPLFTKCNLTTSHPMTNRAWVTFPCLFGGSLIISCIMTNSLWVILPILLLCTHCMTSNDQQLVSDTALLPLPFLPCSLITSHDQQGVSDLPVFLPYSLITSHSMAYRQWGHHPFFYHAISSLPIPW